VIRPENLANQPNNSIDLTAAGAASGHAER
jgi:hypothetical protein